MKILKFKVNNKLSIELELFEADAPFAIKSSITNTYTMIQQLTQEKGKVFPETMMAAEFTDKFKNNPDILFKIPGFSIVESRRIYQMDGIEFLIAREGLEYGISEIPEVVKDVQESLKSIFPSYSIVNTATTAELRSILRPYSTNLHLNEFCIEDATSAKTFEYFKSNPEKFIYDTSLLSSNYVTPSATLKAITDSDISYFRHIGGTGSSTREDLLVPKLPMYNRANVERGSILLNWFATIDLDRYDYRHSGLSLDSYESLYEAVAKRLGYTNNSRWYTSRAGLIADEELDDILAGYSIDITEFTDAKEELNKRQTLLGKIARSGLAGIVSIELK